LSLLAKLSWQQEDIMTTQTKTSKSAKMTRRVATRKPRISAKNRAALRLLDSMMDCSEEEAQDQRETFELLQKALIEYPLSFRQPLAENAAREANEMNTDGENHRA
jgi:hypothetical protein